MSDLTAMVLMVIVTLMALSIIWGTYVRQYLLEAKEMKAALAERYQKLH
jgi:cell division protein FtsL